MEFEQDGRAQGLLQSREELSGVGVRREDSPADVGVVPDQAQREDAGGREGIPGVRLLDLLLQAQPVRLLHRPPRTVPQASYQAHRGGIAGGGEPDPVHPEAGHGQCAREARRDGYGHHPEGHHPHRGPAGAGEEHDHRHGQGQSEPEKTRTERGRRGAPHRARHGEPGGAARPQHHVRRPRLAPLHASGLPRAVCRHCLTVDLTPGD